MDDHSSAGSRCLSSLQSSTVSFVCYHVLIPIVTLCGIIGNCLNLVVLSEKRLRNTLGRRVQSANQCLKALAISDLLVCFFVFPTGLSPHHEIFFKVDFYYYYAKYSYVFINTFIFSSTWLTVLLATERYVAVCYPLKACHFITLTKTRVSILVTFIISVLFNIPYVYRINMKIHVENCSGTSHHDNRLYHTFEFISFPVEMEHIFRITWTLLGNILPLILLFIFNVRLTMTVSKAHSVKFRRKSSMSTNFSNNITKRLINRSQGREFETTAVNRSPCNVSYNNTRVTITLISIIVTFLLLVAPSEIVKHIIFSIPESNTT